MISIDDKLSHGGDFSKGYALLVRDEERNPRLGMGWPFDRKRVSNVDRVCYLDGTYRENWLLTWDGIFVYDKNRIPSRVVMSEFEQGKLARAVHRVFEFAFSEVDNVCVDLREIVKNARAGLIGLFLLDAYGDEEIMSKVYSLFYENPKLLAAMNMNDSGIISGDLFLDTVYRVSKDGAEVDFPRVR